MFDITALSNGDSLVGINLMIYEAQIKKTKAGRDYLACTLGNSTGKLEARWWNVPSTMSVPKAGEVYTIIASVTEYAGIMQLNINSMTKVPEENVDISDFTIEVSNKLSTNDIDVLTHHVSCAIDGNEFLTKIWNKFIDCGMLDACKAATAACGIHHAGVGGWIKHTAEVVDYAYAIYCSLPAPTKSLVRYDILMMGAFFHDIGKLRAYTFENGVPVMTKRGMLLEHLVDGCMLLDEFAGNVANDDLLAIQHCIASHHMELEWGSPVNPVSIESTIIAYADQLSASLDTITQAFIDKPTNDDEWTQKIYTQHNRKFISFVKE